MTEAEEEQALAAAKPSWMKDGKNVQGDRKVFYSDRAAGMPDASRQSQDNWQPPPDSRASAEGPERIPSANASDPLPTIPNIIVVFNGTPDYVTFTAAVSGPV